MCCSVLQCVAVCCSVLQCVAVRVAPANEVECFSAMQCVAVRCGVCSMCCGTETCVCCTCG